VAGAGPAGDVRERPARPEQSPREHPHRPPHLDHGRQAGGGQPQRPDGGQDHRQGHHVAARQRRGDQPGAVDTGAFKGGGERRTFLLPVLILLSRDHLKSTKLLFAAL